MGSPLLAMLNPRKRSSAAVFPDGGDVAQAPDWSNDTSANIGPVESNVQEVPAAAPMPDPLKTLLQGNTPADATADPMAPGNYAKAKTEQLGQAEDTIANAKAAASSPRRAISGGNPQDAQDTLDEFGRAKTQDQEAFKQYQDLASFLSPDQSAQRAAVQKDKIDAETAVPKIQGQTAIDVAKIGAQSKNYVADQNLAGKNAAAAMKAMASNDFPAQIKAQAINAAATADHIDTVLAQVDDPDLQAFMGPIAGRLSKLAQGRLGIDPINPFDGLDAGQLTAGMSADPNITRKLGQFTTNLILAASGIARAHNQRGATKELLDTFEGLLTQAQAPELLKGSLDASKGMMLVYAHPKPFSPAGGDPFQRMLGITPQAAPTAPGAPPAAAAPPVTNIQWVQGPDGKLHSAPKR